MFDTSLSGVGGAPTPKMPPITEWYIPVLGAPTIGFDHPDGSGFVAALDIAVGGPFARAIAEEVLAALQSASRAQASQPEVEHLLNWSRPMSNAAR